MKIFDRILFSTKKELALFKKYILLKRKTKRLGSNEKTVFINIYNPDDYKFYLYNFIKFFLIEGYVVYIPNSLFNFRKFNKHISNVFIENSVVLKSFPKANLVFDDGNLSVDYFNATARLQNKGYFIPMSSHPQMYQQNHWDRKLNTEKLYTKAILVGNFNADYYSQINSTKFDSIPRHIIYNYLLEKKIAKTLSISKNVLNVGHEVLNFPCVFVDRTKNEIPQKHLRNFLNKFYFFLAAPGVLMPFSHNIIEAMSVGSIPILQRNYANLFMPALSHRVNCLIFDDLNQLGNLLLEIEFLELTPIKQMSRNTQNYYNQFLSPSAVVERIKLEYKNKNTFYLLGELNSIEKMS
ncbi:hypothetical protein [Leeuwenhoekiella sp. MAR_2009_132]|uniref:hypothetical protein n=1 Tax=Leeuwenhoekiella sp. MAR_2009_132 TaxID=1392489 RepID=UPI00048B6282|nr:hypothetical protein [Leeuwenhoekiella sp. MAR_2009_132]